MENLERYKMKSLGMKLERKGDLIYHEGPLLSHFVDCDNANYFYKWSDCDDNYNRWLIFKVDTEKLVSFFQSSTSLLNLIVCNSFVHFVDLDNDLNEVNAYICPTEKIPLDYLPSEQSFFKEKKYEQYALELKNKLEFETKQKHEFNIFEMLLKEVLVIKKNQKRQDILLTLIFQKMAEKKSSGLGHLATKDNLNNLLVSNLEDTENISILETTSISKQWTKKYY